MAAASSGSSSPLHRVVVAPKYTTSPFQFTFESRDSIQYKIVGYPYSPNLIDAEQIRSKCTSIFCCIFCCVYCPDCKKEEADAQSEGIRRYAIFFESKYGEKISALVRQILKIDFPNLRTTGGYLTLSQDLELKKYADLVLKYGVVTIKTALAIKDRECRTQPLTYSDLEGRVRHIQASCQIEAQALLIRLYYVYEEIRSGTSIEAMFKSLAEHSTKSHTQTYSPEDVQSYVYRLKTTEFKFNFETIASIVNEKISKRKISSDFELEIYIAAAIYESGDPFIQPGVLSKLSEAAIEQVKKDIPETWPDDLLVCFFRCFKKGHQRFESRRFFDLHASSKSSPASHALSSSSKLSNITIEDVGS